MLLTTRPTHIIHSLNDSRIDIAVEYPSDTVRQFVAGIECDGFSYAAARTARDRDRLRSTVLKNMGWNLYRIWSAEWYRNPEIEGKNLILFLTRAVSSYEKKIREHMRSLKNGADMDPEENAGVEMCSEPTVAYVATGSGYANTTYEVEEECPQVPVGKLGFYTDDPMVFETRVAEIEADLAEVESGVDDPQKWATSEQFDQELYQQFPWLR